MDQSKLMDKIGLTFDDVLLLPNYSEVKRSEIELKTNLTRKVELKIPLVSSPMDTVTMSLMAISLGKLGGLGIIHRNMTIKEQVKEVEKVKKENLLTGAAVGVGLDFEDRVSALVNKGVDVLVVDSAHGFCKRVIEATEYISQNYKNIALISGNVATAAGAKALIEKGAGCLRVGMGPGSICTTRIISGMGVPQLTAVSETVKVAKKYNVPVMSDGGIRFSGDVVKALARGASTVMLGSVFASCHEAPGKEVVIEGKKYKKYRGMGSEEAMKEGSACRYGQEYRKGQTKKLTPEGIEGMVPLKGKLEEVVDEFLGGLKAGMYYTGVKNISELQEKTRFVRITNASLIESHPHDIVKTKD